MRASLWLSFFIIYYTNAAVAVVKLILLISRIHRSLPSNIRVMVSFRCNSAKSSRRVFSMTGSTRARVCVECREVLENKDFNHLSALTVSGKLRSQLFLCSKTP